MAADAVEVTAVEEAVAVEAATAETVAMEAIYGCGSDAMEVFEEAAAFGRSGRSKVIWV